MGSTSVRSLRAVLGGLSLLTASLTGSACIEGVVEVPEGEVGDQEQEATGTKPAPPGGATLQLQGGAVSVLSSTAVGGDRVAHVTTQNGGAFVKKTGDSVAVEPLTFAMYFAGFSSLQDWVGESFNGKGSMRSGVVTVPNRALEFNNALLSEVSFPKLDGASKESAVFAIKATPGTAFDQGGKGVSRAIGAAAEKPMLASNFRFTLGDLDCKQVAAIDGFTVKIPAKSGKGEFGQAPIDFPELKVRLSVAGAATWIKHMDNTLADGQIDDKEELSGAIEFLSPTMEDVLGTIELQGVGIRRLALDEAGTRYEATLYVENIAFESNGK